MSALAGTPPLTDSISGAAAVATVLESQIAVVTATQGLILAVDDGGGWRVVGLDLDELAEPYLGPAIRRLFIIGSDARPGQNVLGFRADSLHILTIVTATEEGALVGIPRDSWVETPSGGNRKFTNIMARNGPELIVETAELLTGLDFEGHIVTGFKGFADVINEFGTFLFDVPFGMAEPKSGAYFRSGEQEFDGDDALAFSRNRTISGGDFTRQLHGGLILLAILAEARMVGPELIPELLAQFTEHVFTDLSAEDLLTLAVAVYRLDPAMVPNLVVPGTVGSAGAASVVFLGDAAEAIFADLQDGTIDTDG